MNLHFCTSLQHFVPLLCTIKTQWEPQNLQERGRVRLHGVEIKRSGKFKYSGKGSGEFGLSWYDSGREEKQFRMCDVSLVAT